VFVPVAVLHAVCFQNGPKGDGHITDASAGTSCVGTEAAAVATAATSECTVSASTDATTTTR